MKKIACLSLILLAGCSAKQDIDPRDPYETVNRKIYKFNKAIDTTLFKPVAKVYKAILPPQVHNSIRNFFDNLQMVPTVANDLLQAEFLKAYKDTWRLFINSTIGVAGLFDVAEKWSLPYVSNDFGITLAKWGDKNSPYFVMPFFGPSTFRDTVGISFDYNILSTYAYFPERTTAYGLMALNTLQIRSDLLDTESLLADAIDEYSFVRNAYLQNRQYDITGEKMSDKDQAKALYLDGNDEDDSSLYVDDEVSDKQNKSNEDKLNTSKNIKNKKKNS